MNRRSGWIAAGAIVLGSALMLSLAWGLQHAALSRPAVIGNIAPQLAIQTLDGAQVRVSELRGKPVVLDFWASWCVSCAEDLPVLSSASSSHPAVAFVGAAMQDTTGAVRTFEQRHPHPYPVGEIVGGDYKAYGVLAPPVTFFIDAQGVVVASFTGPLDSQTIDHYLGLIG
ncbi:MAG: redoxin domain-containing protein [Candidatus Dormibacteraeota bacterium]|nr:redoxin domain-containing protein [Candidatus Dormibacteraeota bacterium]